MSARQPWAIAVTAVVTLLACGKGNDTKPAASPVAASSDAPASAAGSASATGAAVSSSAASQPTAASTPAHLPEHPPGGGGSPVPYTYCRNVCSRVEKCKEFDYAGKGCMAACQTDMVGSNQRDFVASAQCVLDGKSTCAQYATCFEENQHYINYDWTDGQVKAACTKHCDIIQGSCKARFGFDTAAACMTDCMDGVNGRSRYAGRIDVLCTNVAQSCDEVEECGHTLDDFDNQPAPTYHSTTPSAKPAQKACANVGDECTSDSQCCGRSATVRCWSGHCKSR